MSKKKLLNNKLKYGIIAVAILAISYVGYTYKIGTIATSAEEPAYTEKIVQRGDLVVDFTADGTADLPVTNLDFPIPGQIEEAFVTVGQDVKKGDALARLDNTDYMNQLEQTRLENAQKLIAGKRSLDQLKAKMETAELEYLPVKQIQEYYSRQEVELKRIAYEDAKSAYEAELQNQDVLKTSAEIAVKACQDKVDDTVLVSPIDGKVLAIEFNTGETIPEDQTFMVLLDAENAELIAHVSEIDLGKVSIGQKVETEFDAFEGQIYTGKVVFIDNLPVIDSSGLVNYEVRIELEEGLNKIKTGMTCTISFILKQKQGVLIIPNKAVNIINGQQVVKVKDKNGEVEQRNIQTGFSDGLNAEVLNGLKPGEIVLLQTNP